LKRFAAPLCVLAFGISVLRYEILVNIQEETPGQPAKKIG
jgi:hypothetical protein